MKNIIISIIITTIIISIISFFTGYFYVINTQKPYKSADYSDNYCVEVDGQIYLYD